MAWIKEKKDSNVRGILLVKELSKKAKYSIKGSKFPIKVIEFKDLILI